MSLGRKGEVEEGLGWGSSKNNLGWEEPEQGGDQAVSSLTPCLPEPPLQSHERQAPKSKDLNIGPCPRWPLSRNAERRGGTHTPEVPNPPCARVRPPKERQREAPCGEMAPRQEATGTRRAVAFISAAQILAFGKRDTGRPLATGTRELRGTGGKNAFAEPPPPTASTVLPLIMKEAEREGRCPPRGRGSGSYEYEQRGRES